MSHVLPLLDGIVAKPERPVGTSPLLGRPERSSSLLKSNTTAARYSDTQCIHTLFETQATRTPDAVALVFGEQQITYRMLNRCANRIARRLRELNVGPEVMVGLCMERSPEQIASIFGILKAGAAYVPLDPTYPRERLALMLDDTKTPVILTQQRVCAQLPAHNAQVLCIDEEQAADNEADDLNIDAGATIDSLAYVIYTSGSTGTPKGAMIDQRGLVNHSLAMVDSHALDASDRVLQFSSLSFDASAASLFPALIVGAALVLPQVASTELLGDQLTQLCERTQITVLQLPASVWHRWVDELEIRGLPLQIPLKVLLVGGESPLIDKLHTWVRLAGRSMTFLNAYGPTEAAITTTLYRIICNEATIAAIQSIPMGRPIANKQVYLLDAHMQPVPFGTTGEVYIGGVGLARGYLNRPELTAERFIEWPLNERLSMRLYRTGDLARCRPDGNLEFLGRIDHQVKLRGFRIELGEIEATLRQHPSVRSAVVLAREDVPGLQHLVAYIVDSDGTTKLDRTYTHRSAIDQLHNELRAFLRTKLPEHMVPSAFVSLHSLPLTTNGKLDRQALPPPEQGTPNEPTAPRTPEEALLTGIWAMALGRPHIGIHDDFFALGGHSLLAARAMVLVKTALNRDIPLRMLYEAPTVAAFARMLRDGDLPAPAAPINLAAEIALDPLIEPPASVRRQIDPAPKAIFVTGVTGFLGAFLLHELLVQTKATIYCLVRARDEQDADLRIQQTLSEYQIWRNEWRDRIVPVVGDLRYAQFGLDTALFQSLARTIDVIYHAGAQVHYLYPYSALKAANVLGSIEVLRLAALERIKPVHYISSIAVTAITDSGLWSYEDDHKRVNTQPIGYAQSKWVAEGIMRLAQARSIPVTIYRPGRIGSHSQTGATNLDDSFVRLLAGCIQLGLAPDIPMVENLIPVDYAAQMIVHLSQQPMLENKTFHLLNPQSIAWQWVAHVTLELGYQCQLVPYHQWHRALMQAAATDPGHPLHGLLMLMPVDQTAANWLDPWAIQKAHNNTTELAGSAIHCPAVDALQLQRTLADSLRRGLFAVPAPLPNISAAPVL
jgi:amino acid adenylation domain-containing protein/thioester reductase-like protein